MSDDTEALVAILMRARKSPLVCQPADEPHVLTLLAMGYLEGTRDTAKLTNDGRLALASRVGRVLSVSLVHAATEKAARTKNEFAAKALLVLTDSKRAERLAAATCPSCFYLPETGLLSGSGFTTYDCAACGEPLSYPNTDVPLLCVACAKKKNLCVRCSADLDLRPRRKLSIENHLRSR